MDNSFYKKVTGKQITGSRWVLFLLGMTIILNWTSGFKFVYSNFTEEGKRWKRMVKLSREAERVMAEIIGGNQTLSRFDRQMRAHVTNPEDLRTWWALFEIFEDRQVALMVQDFLSTNKATDLQAFGKTCTRLADQIQQVTGIDEVQGAVLKEKGYIRTIAIQQLAACFAEFTWPRRTEEQIKRQLRTY